MSEREYLAHSVQEGYPAQSYSEHIKNVQRSALRYAEQAASYAVLDGDLLIQAVETAACIHDLGKLHAENQEALNKPDNKAALPINHVDAGVVCLQRSGELSAYAELAVYSHHRGLPDMARELNRGDECFRYTNKRNQEKEKTTRKKADGEWAKLLRLHHNLTEDAWHSPDEREMRGDCGVFCRMMLSCLSDADHSDAARHYGKYPIDTDEPPLLQQERLKKLDDYVKVLESDSARNRLRSEMYAHCRSVEIDGTIAACDSPVGSGKTTAIMAHLLQQAIRRKSRRIFVVLPFTNIIKQSVDVYRKALVLPGENPERIVAELHHRADFESPATRSLNTMWQAPIIVTTAVAFFETLASNRPAALRRLHELPGSLIFVDEAHAALPVKLLPVAWRWIKTLADEWQCYWILASGSLVEFWKLEAIGWRHEYRDVPHIVSNDLREKLHRYESCRIRFCYDPKPLCRDELVAKVVSSPGPRLLIMNTVQNAAVMAMDLQNFYGDSAKVMHLSTALNAQDRGKTIDSIKKRLLDFDDTDWTLVATSCVEAGVDFSFKTGFREVSSLLSLLQTAGRINRSGEDDDAVIFSFVMRDDEPMLRKNPGFKVSAEILTDYFEKRITIEPLLSTDSMQRELNHTATDFKTLLDAEESCQFSKVQEKFRVIDDDTLLVIADNTLKKKIRHGGCNWTDIQKMAISVRRYVAEKLNLKMLSDGIYDWYLGYDDFLGIMRGLIDYQKTASEILMY